MKRLEGYRAIVTGATSGIGLGITKQFLEDGATVIGIGRDFQRTTELGGNFIPFKCDAFFPEQIKAATDFAAEKFEGKLDILVNNAGRGTYGTIDNFTDDEFDTLFHLILRAPMMFTRNCLPLMQNRPNASILNVASASAMSLDKDQFMYSIAKTGLVKFTQLTAKTHLNLRANCICPGIIETPIFQHCPPEYPLKGDDFKAFGAALPSKRIGQPEDIAKLATFLATEDAVYINGANIVVDGGMTTLIT